jgi:hypothetical protein
MVLQKARSCPSEDAQRCSQILPGAETLIRNTILFAMNAVERYAERVIDVMARGKGALEALSEANAASEEGK